MIIKSKADYLSMDNLRLLALMLLPLCVFIVVKIQKNLENKADISMSLYPDRQY